MTVILSQQFFSGEGVPPGLLGAVLARALALHSRQGREPLRGNFLIKNRTRKRSFWGFCRLNLTRSDRAESDRLFRRAVRGHALPLPRLRRAPHARSAPRPCGGCWHGGCCDWVFTTRQSSALAGVREKKKIPPKGCVFSSQRAVRRGKRGEAQTECLRSTGSAKEALHLR